VNGTCDSCDSDDQPVPKSSIDRPKPFSQQPRQHREAARGVGHQRALGEFEHDLGRVHPGLAHDALVTVGGAGVVQGRGRDIHRQLQPQPGAVPVALPAAGLGQHAFGQFVEQVIAFEHRHEMLRQDHPAVAAAPARERFDPDHPAVAQLHLRLEPRHDVAAGQGGADGFGGDLAGRVFLHVGRGFAQAAQGRGQFGFGQRLGHRVEHAQAAGAGHGLHGMQQGRVERADHQHRARQVALGEVVDEFDPVHARHVQVDHDHVRRLRHRLQQAQRAGAVGGLEGAGDAQFRQQAQRHAALEAVVFDHQDAQCRYGHQFPGRATQPQADRVGRVRRL